MTVQAIGLGVVGNELSKKIVGSSEVSVGRTCVATGTGAVIGATTSGVLIIASTAAGLAAAPVAVPLTLFVAGVSCLASLFG